MKLFVIRSFSFLLILTLSSCNSEKKKNEKKIEIEKSEEQIEYSKMLNLHDPVFFDEEAFNYKFSYELSIDYLDKNIICKANILDVVKIDDTKYVIIAKGEGFSLHLDINNQILNELLVIRSDLILDDDEWIKWFGLSYTDFIFVIKPYAINKEYELYTSVSDYNVVEEELDDYYVNIELDNAGFKFKADCIDFMLAEYISLDIKD